MEKLIFQLIDHLSREGPWGLSLLICLASMGFSLAMGWFYHRYKILNLQNQLEESKLDKQQLMTLVKSNTLSIERNTSALKSNTETVKHCIQLIQHMVQKLKL